jgi:DNA-directed RNA polymerase subunit alpha
MNEQPTFEIKQEEKKENYAKFAISPLEQGYGQTLGNSLRRVLLTSLGGAAVTSVKISGVKHQFSSLKGMKEDVVEFILNLKKVRFIYEGDDPVKASISAEGPGEVTAKDIEIPGDVEISNKDLVLATLSKDGKLSASIQIESGSGYRSAEEQENKEIGLIPVDASFSPITRVNYTVEETRVGRRTNFDKLNLELWTDGTVDPKEALVKASKTLDSYLNQIISPKKVEKKEEEKDEGLGPVGKLSVEEIGLPTRVANALVKAGHETVEDLAGASRKDLTKVRNLGEKSVKIIEAALGEKDVELGE